MGSWTSDKNQTKDSIECVLQMLEMPFTFFPIVILVVFSMLIILVTFALLMLDAKRKREHRLALAQVKRIDEQKTSDAQVVRERETIIKEVGMTPCKYCGGSMPRTSLFCPNCGARRTSA